MCIIKHYQICIYNNKKKSLLQAPLHFLIKRTDNQLIKLLSRSGAIQHAQSWHNFQLSKAANLNPEQTHRWKRLKKCLAANLPFVLKTQRSACDYTIDWIICKGQASRLLSLPLLSHSAANPMVRPLRHILRHLLRNPVPGNVYRNTCPPTQEHAG